MTGRTLGQGPDPNRESGDGKEREQADGKDDAGGGTHRTDLGSKAEGGKGQKPGKFPASLPSVDAANHTPKITKHHKTVSTQHKIPTTQNIRKPPGAIWPPDIWKTILLSV